MLFGYIAQEKLEVKSLYKPGGHSLPGIVIRVEKSGFYSLGIFPL
jgi:hypothetical protein